MSRRRFSRVIAYLAPALPLASMACGQGFNGETPGPDGEPDGGSIRFGDGSAGRDSAAHDAGSGDARRDGASHDANAADSEAVPEADAPEAQTEAAAETGTEAGTETDAETDAAEAGGGCPASKPTLCNGTTCVNTSDDPQNCNGCGNACAGNPPDSQPTCSGGMCGFACNPGFEQCGSTCLGAVPDTSHGVFVAPGGPSRGCGTPDLPCGTISAGIAAIEQADGGTKNIVYVAESATPYVEQVTLAAGITIEGGWVDMGAGEWSHPCALDASQVVVQAPAGVDGVVLASSGGAATLRTLTLVNEPSAPGAGQSLFGAIVSGSGTQLSLENVQVELGTAGSGANGSAGAAGTGAVACTTPGDSNAGAPVGSGTAGTAGTYSPSGYQSGGSGGTGPIGNPGDNGGAGGTGGTCTPTVCAQNSLVCSVKLGTTQTGAAGSPGCGGNGGQGGTGGTGGGSSIAVLAWGPGVQVSITGGVLAPGDGGTGGGGGPGGAGAPGVAGVAGTSKTCFEHHCSGTQCISLPSTTASGGAAGGAGGAGGQGGTGGGGAGGDSYCSYAGDGATVTGTFQCQQAAGGAGGAPNGPPGTGAAHN